MLLLSVIVVTLGYDLEKLEQRIRLGCLSIAPSRPPFRVV
jgi:hypothetical protein